MSNTRKICTFYLKDHLVGIPIDRIRDIMEPQDMTPVPHAPPVVEGLLNLRGEIVTAVNLRKRIGLPERDASDEMMHIVIEYDEEFYSLLVDRVGDMTDVEAESFEELPDTLDPKIQTYATGVYKLEELLVVLDLSKITDLKATSTSK